jgi:2-dehydropantoate 2-reductase
MQETFRRVAVVGAGAVGSFFGAMLARAGLRVVLIGRPAHAQAIARDGLRLEMAGRTESVALEASSEIAAVRSADLVLFSVKSTDTETVARELASALDRDALVVSLQNGVENAATSPPPSFRPSSTSRRRCPSRAWSATTAAATSSSAR